MRIASRTKPDAAQHNYRLMITSTFFLDSGRSSVWGDGTGSTAVYGPITLPIVLGHVGETKTLYGRIPARQTSRPAGSCSDTVTITINF